MKFRETARLLVIFCGLILPPVTSLASVMNSGKSAFREISLTTAREMAREEGKHIFLEFYADWCVPCKWMEETALADKEVKEILSQNYIALRVDIDDFDGFAVKEHYGIKVLPTMLIVDEHGKVVRRKEQSMSPEMLLDLLRSNRVEIPIAPVNSAPSRNMDQFTGQAEILPAITPDPEEIANHATVETKVYRVQVGVYADYANTQNLVNNLREKLDEPVVVLNGQLKGKTVFRVLVGDFESKSLAELFKNELGQKYGIEGFVK